MAQLTHQPLLAMLLQKLREVGAHNVHLHSAQSRSAKVAIRRRLERCGARR
jgi:hypothetical protein